MAFRTIPSLSELRDASALRDATSGDAVVRDNALGRWTPGPVTSGLGLFIGAGGFHIVYGAPSFTYITLGNLFGVWALDATAEEGVACASGIPDGWATANIDLYWTNLGANTGGVRWRCYWASISDGEAIAATTPNITAAAPAQHVVKVSRIATGIAVTPGDIVMFTPFRVGGHADDTLANDAGVLGARVTKGS